ncbi:YhgE/Pip domain-containing protein [Protaetiibacter larvae]|uniref:YhgE/Pip domain-containing protein n=1 Tax=Protaetiibacter larvae TaxID=2592654 RepID=A0A5C1Y5Y0_9MICO|nr:YhgE/Pip family protein [Protaetiibacter larvae]QEO09120.1 YhgE/Pip domain-containing protein [Protaetiibacter larvae]
MKIPAMIQAEFRRLTATPMALVALLALCTVPVLYGGLYLWANQDPDAHFDRIPVALVMQDAGGERDGEHVVVGREVADELLDDGTFDWREVSAADAASGLAASRYDFAVTIPQDFTASLLSAADDAPHPARLELATNDAGSYLATTIGNQAAETVLGSVTRQVTEQAVRQLLDGVADIRVGMADAASGAVRLADGTADAASGATSLADGTSTLAAGAAQVADGNAALAAQADRLAAAEHQVYASLPRARADIAAQLAAAGLTPEQADAVLARLDSVGSAIDDADATVRTTVDRIDQLAAGARQVADGAASAASGAAQLRDGLGALDTGARELRDGLDAGLAQLPDQDADARATQAAALADPVALETSNLAQASNYGAGLAPFFVSLAAWIGIYALFLIVKPVSRRAITALHSPIKVTLAGWLTPGILGVLQMAALFLVVAGPLGFAMAVPWGVFGMMALAALCFAAIILALNVWLGSVGQFTGLVLMVLQLVTAGGTFPWQTLPEPLASLHHVLPMGYAVDAIRQFMYGGDVGRALIDALVLAGWTLVALGFAALGVTRMTHFRTLRDLEPSLIG